MILSVEAASQSRIEGVGGCRLRVERTANSTGKEKSPLWMLSKRFFPLFKL
jgi:hypothetical protein